MTVVNKGVGGETAEQMLARFTRDVLPYRPQLVIWQTGSNHALQSEDVQGYEQTVRAGIARLKAAHMDVILMDPQYAPRILGRPLHKAIVDTIGEVSNDLKVAVFRRFAVMRHWVTSGQYRMEDIISHDQLHMNDASYHCIARLLADSLASAALATPLPQADDPITIGQRITRGQAPFSAIILCLAAHSQATSPLVWLMQKRMPADQSKGNNMPLMCVQEGTLWSLALVVGRLYTRVTYSGLYSLS